MIGHLVIIFAYHFPPENAIGGARPFRFAKYLSRLGYSCRVFTAADQTGRHDPNTEYVPDPFVASRRYGISWQLERAVRKLFLPGDVGLHWSHRAAAAARAFIRGHQTDRITVISTFPPVGSHLAALQLVENEKMAWIADFWDPLTDEFWDKSRPFSQLKAYQQLERLIARRADAVIANTDTALTRWQDKFPSLRNKCHVIWNGFDPEDRIAALPVLSPNRKTLSHVGELYQGRTASTILESITRLIDARRLAAGSVQVRLIGPAEANCLPSRDFIADATSKGWLDLVARQITQDEARQVARTSDALLLLQQQSAAHVPAKLFEYLQIGRPILAFIQPGSPCERLLQQSNVPYRCVYPTATPEVVDDTVAGFLELPSKEVTASPWFEEQFNGEYQTRQLDAIIRSINSEQPIRALHTPVPRSRPRSERHGTALASRTDEAELCRPHPRRG